MPIARPEFGPSLLDVAGPRWRALSRRWRWILIAIVAVLVLVAAGYFTFRGRSLEQVVVRGPLTFNTRFDSRIRQVPPQPGELLRLEDAPGRAPEELVFRDGGPAPTRDEPAGGPVAQLALRMTGVMRGVQRELAGNDLQIRSRGRVKIGRDYAGWLVRYQFRRDGKTWYGVRVLLLPDVSGARERVLDMSLRSQRSAVVDQVSQAGTNGPMRTPFYGVAFGTEKP